MKFKNDFVTNSSSTSFIISTKTNDREELQVVMKKTINLQDYVEKTFTTESELMDYFCYEDDEVKELLNEIRSGRIVHLLSLCDDEDSLERQLYYEGLSGIETKETVKIIDGKGRNE